MTAGRFLSVVLVLGLALGATPAAAEGDHDELEALRQRVGQLEAENREIRQQLAALAARLAPPGEVAPPAPDDAAPASPASPASPTEAQAAVPREVAAGESRLGFYGFVRFDAIYDDSRPSAFQTPVFIESEDPSTGLDDDGNLTFHPRLTRFGIRYAGPEVAELGGARLGGKLEIDFQNGGRESRAVPRFRHAYLDLGWEGESLLVGQTWDLISPLYPSVNADTLMWNAGNLGDRRPQVRYTHTAVGGLTLAAALGLTGAVDAQDLDNDGVRDGEAAELPNLQARVGWSGGGADGWGVGLWGHVARLETAAAFAGERDFDSRSLGVDYRLGLSPEWTLQGELWTGSGLGDFRGGIGQSVNPATGEEIASRGGWVELGYRRPSGWSAFAGYTLDDPDNDEVPAGGRIENGAWYLGNRVRAGKSFLVGLDYLRWTTEYQGLADGVDNRFNLYVIYDF